LMSVLHHCACCCWVGRVAGVARVAGYAGYAGGRYFDGTHYRFKSLKGRWLAIHPNEVGGGSGGSSCLLVLSQRDDHVLISSADGTRYMAFSGDGKRSQHPNEVSCPSLALATNVAVENSAEVALVENSAEVALTWERMQKMHPLSRACTGRECTDCTGRENSAQAALMLSRARTDTLT
jgi:hypothetical protein